ncbi:sugar ABC transporter substrate-binding protein [Clostridia bacterium]|nr:sugar ABC transporter substrate-binding protein [Clostridia bacterium]
MKGINRIITAILALAILLSMTAVPAAVLAEADRPVVTFWNQIFEEWNRTWWEEVAQEYNDDASQPYTIQMEFIDGGAVEERLAAARAAGTTPDIFVINYSNLPRAVQEGYTYPTEGLIAPEAYDDLYENVREMITVGDHTYGYPQMLEPAVVMYYRKDLLEAAGLSVPKTWDEFRAAAAALTTDDMFGATMNYEWSLWGWEYTAAGHWPITEDWSQADLDQGYIDLLQFIGDLYHDESVPAQALEGYNGSSRLVCDDSVAITFSGSWGIGAIMTDYPEMAELIGVAAAPTKDGSPFHSTVGGWTLQIDAHSKNPEGAAHFISYALAEDVARTGRFFEAANFSKYSTRKSVDEYLTTNTAAKDDEWMQAVTSEIIPYAISEPIYNWEISAYILAATGEVVINNITPEEALATATSEINTFITNNNLAK